MSENSDRCPVCTNWVRLQDAGMVKHVLDHLVDAAHRKPRYIQTGQSLPVPWVHCFCGVEIASILLHRTDPDVAVIRFAGHLEEHGGAHAHYLSWRLGVQGEA